MKTIILEEELPCSADKVWSVLGEVTRNDWVPGVGAITLKDGVRSFAMEGVGEVQERILIHDAADYCLQYAAIKIPIQLDHHLATIQLTPAGHGCLLTWSCEIAPDEFAEGVELRMAAAIKKLLTVLESLQQG